MKTTFYAIRHRNTGAYIGCSNEPTFDINDMFTPDSQEQAENRRRSLKHPDDFYVVRWELSRCEGEPAPAKDVS